MPSATPKTGPFGPSSCARCGPGGSVGSAWSSPTSTWASKAAVEAVMVGSAWQRCRVHFMRNVLARVKRTNTHMVIAAIQTIFAQPDAAAVREQFDRIVATLEGQFPDVATMLDRRQGGPAGLHGLPRGPLAQGLVDRIPWSASTERSSGAPTWSGSFPNDQAVERLVTAVVVETHDEWQVAERRYLSETSMAQLRRIEKAAVAEAAHDALESRPLAG